MNNKFSENLKKIRKEHNLSQEQLADEIGVSRQAISKWESKVAYPEMDKILILCDKFDLSIDDLLHKDIKEVKGEEESKKKISKYIDDFLKFITDTINLFSNMNFKSKIKCLFEQLIIICVLLIISFFIIVIADYIVSDILSILTGKLTHFIHSVLNLIIVLFCIISSLIILTHIFKTRYLDYYDKLKEEVNDKTLEDKEKDGSNKEETIDKKNKILFKRNENKIIIRDPKNSEYKFINGLFSIIIGIIKFFALCIALFVCFVLIGLFSAFIISFLVYKTGFFFVGLLATILSSAVVAIIILLIIFNFVFNRKNDKKKMILSFITSLIVFGIGSGLMFVGFLNFDVLEQDDTVLKTGQIEFEMKDNTFFNIYGDNVNIEYVEADISNIKIEYKINKYCKLKSHNNGAQSGIRIWSSCNNPTKLARYFIKNINNKKVITIDNVVKNIVVYASIDNIEKIKNNEKNYFSMQEEYEQLVNSYEERINEFEIQKDEYENKIYDYENKLLEQKEEYEEKISELREKIENLKSELNM